MDKTLDRKRIAAVCGNEVIIFSGQRPSGVRNRLESYHFGTHGAALAYAAHFDETERKADIAQGRMSREGQTA